LLPELATAGFLEVRVGLRPATADELPIVGPSSTMRRVFYATGHYRNGVLLTPITAEIISRLIITGELDSIAAPFTLDRFALAGGRTR
jgi:glycine oxidase